MESCGACFGQCRDALLVSQQTLRVQHGQNFNTRTSRCVTYVMEEALRSLTEVSMRRYAAFIAVATSYRVEVSRAKTPSVQRAVRTILVAGPNASPTYALNCVHSRGAFPLLSCRCSSRVLVLLVFSLVFAQSQPMPSNLSSEIPPFKTP